MSPTVCKVVTLMSSILDVISNQDEIYFSMNTKENQNSPDSIEEDEDEEYLAQLSLEYLSVARNPFPLHLFQKPEQSRMAKDHKYHFLFHIKSMPFNHAKIIKFNL